METCYGNVISFHPIKEQNVTISSWCSHCI